jgi:large subunit ribosomal protein L29
VKVEEIRALGTEELKKQLEEAHQELFNLRFRLSTKQLVNHRELPRVRKKIATLKTILRERELSIGDVHGNKAQN